MKKLIALLLVLALVLSFATVFTACGDDTNYSAEDDDDDDDDDSGKKDPSGTVTPLSDEDAAKAALQNAIDLFYNGKSSGFASAVPEVVWEYYVENKNHSKATIINNYRLFGEYTNNTLADQVGSDPNVTITVNTMDDCPETHLSAARQLVSSDYGWEIPADAKAYLFNCAMECVGAESTQTAEDQEYVAVKYEGKFYIFSIYTNDEQYYAKYIANYVLEYIVHNLPTAGPSDSETNDNIVGVPDDSNADHNAAKAALERFLNIRYYGINTELSILAPQELWDYFADSYGNGKSTLLSYANDYAQMANEDRISYVGPNTELTYEIYSILECQSNIYSAVQAEMASDYNWNIPDNCKAYYMDVSLSFSDNDLSCMVSAELVALEYNGVWYMFEYYTDNGTPYVDCLAFEVLYDLNWFAEGCPSFD